MSKERIVGTTGADEGKLLSLGDALICMVRSPDGSVGVYSSMDGGNTWVKEVEFVPNERQAEATRA